MFLVFVLELMVFFFPVSKGMTSTIYNSILLLLHRLWFMLHLGPLVDAMRNGYWVILDELNLAPTDVLEALNRVCEWVDIIGKFCLVYSLFRCLMRIENFLSQKLRRL